MSISYWKETALLTATFHEPDLKPDDATGLEVWGDTPGASWVNYELSPVWTGSAGCYRPNTLIEYLSDGMGMAELIGANMDAVKAMMSAERQGGSVTVTLLTVWECESGRQYIPGEADEYVSDVQLVGYYTPKTLEYVGL